MFLFILNRNLGGNALDDCISRQILMRLLGCSLNDYRFSWFRFLFFVFGFVWDPVNKSRQKIKMKKTKNLKYTQVKGAFTINLTCSRAAGNIVRRSRLMGTVYTVSGLGFPDGA